jgi:hypothetical protein
MERAQTIPDLILIIGANRITEATSLINTKRHVSRFPHHTQIVQNGALEPV